MIIVLLLLLCIVCCIISWTHWPQKDSLFVEKHLRKKMFWTTQRSTCWAHDQMSSAVRGLVESFRFLSFQELSEFQCGTVIGCYLCNKSSRIITKWKWLGMTATQPRSGRPCKMTEWGQRMLRRIVRRGRQLFSESITTDLQTSCGLQSNSGTA